MNRKLFLFGFWTIILIAFLLRLLPVRNNNFYFTMDQGNDAVWAREIWSRGQILLRGPETGLTGVFAGPLWFYFISLGYLIFQGHPFGGLLLMIVLNVFCTAMIIWYLAKKISPAVALVIGASLQVFWAFYDASRYAFNPFPLVILSFILIFFLGQLLGGEKKYLILAAVPVGLAFHAEVAGAIALFLFFIVVGIWAIFKKLCSFKTLATSFLVLSLFFLPLFISELTSDFSQFQTLTKALINKDSVLLGTNVLTINWVFLDLISLSVVPQSLFLSLVIFISALGFFWYKKAKNQFISNYISLALLLFGLSYVWFSSSKIWQDWHDVYLPPILSVALLLIILKAMPKKMGLVFLGIILVSQTAFFLNRYREYFRPSNDASLLVNEIKAIDWVYQKAEGQGFYEYNYLPSVYDYPYQYLFWWYGRQKYGYLPCEFATYHQDFKFFIPGSNHYENPKRKCSSLKFLIIEPDLNSNVREQWLAGVRQETTLVEEATIGSIKIEKRLVSADILSKSTQEKEYQKQSKTIIPEND